MDPDIDSESERCDVENIASIINAFCQPEIISRVKDILLER